jgi:hypothetical protein
MPIEDAPIKVPLVGTAGSATHELIRWLNLVSRGIGNVTPKADDVETVAATSYWTPDAGIYQLLNIVTCAWQVEIYVNGAWRQQYSTRDFAGDILYFDGTNMRIRNSLGVSKDIYYLKF